MQPGGKDCGMRAPSKRLVADDVAILIVTNVADDIVTNVADDAAERPFKEVLEALAPRQ